MDEPVCRQTGKVCFTKRGAGECVAGFKGSRGRHKKTIPLRFYYCKCCGMYHLTHLRRPGKSSLGRRGR